MLVISVYIEYSIKSFKARCVYRANIYLNIIAKLALLFVMVSIWESLYKTRSSMSGISLSDMISFVIINMLLSSITRSNIANKIAQKVEDGSICVELTKPVSFQLLMFSEDMGDNLFEILFSTLPICLFALFFYGFKPPANIYDFAFFLLGLFNGIILVFLINYSMGLITFWVKKTSFVEWFFEAFFKLFSGSVIPLWFYPDLLKEISSVLPFRFITFEPIAIYVGKMSVIDSVKVIIMQLSWIGIMLIINSLVWSRVQKKLVVHGG